MGLEGKKVAVTGGAGFIGSEVVRQLAVDHGADVYAIDNLVNGRIENLADVSGIELVEADIRDRGSMRKVCGQADVVFHLACLGVRHSLHSPLENHEVNATATLELLNDARQAQLERFVYVSSSEVYGTARWVPMTEDHPPWPLTVYGSSKLAGECYTRAVFHTYGFPTVVVRPFNTYGPNCHHEGDSGEVIPKFMLRALAGKPMVVFGDGTQTRDFSHVSDTARGIILSGTAEGAVGETINLGTGREVAINQLAEEVAAVVGRPDAPVQHDDPRPGDVLRLCADASRARQVLGFEPGVPLEDGLRRLRDWYLDQDASIEELLEQEIVHNWNPAGA